MSFEGLQSGTELCNLLKYFCNPKLEGPWPHPVMGIIAPSMIHPQGSVELSWNFKPLFSQSYTRGLTSSTKQSSFIASENENIAVQLMQATFDFFRCANIFTQALVGRMSSISSLEVENIDKSMHAYCTNSVVVVEIRSWISKKMRADSAICDIMGDASSPRLGDLLAPR